jgi:hypothetical protein
MILRRLILFAIAAVMVVTLGFPVTATALTGKSDKTFFSLNDILFYDPSACSADGSDSGGEADSLVGNDNLEKALRYYVGKGLTLAQASGILGNFGRESGVNPAIIQGVNGNPPTIASEGYKPVNGVGFGIAQWTFTSRQSGLVALSTSSSRPIIDLGLQLDYSWQELNGSHKAALTSLKAATTADNAAYVFHRDYEGSADSEETVRKNRGGDALQIYAQYRTIIKDGTGNTSSEDAVCTGNGKASEFVDGFAIYNQSDPKSAWARIPYGPGKDVAAAGCGPSAMAMIITALTKQTVTPADTAVYGRDHVPTTVYIEGGVGAGSRHNIHTIIGERWGLKSTNMNRSIPKINEGLRAGGLVILAGSGAAPFTSGGHFIVVRAVTADNKWLVGDSNGTKGIENSKKEWDPVFIMSMVDGYSWLLTK